jgi:O-acetyl-ADP-ribose deacetylase (regulator of RNase III)
MNFNQPTIKVIQGNITSADVDLIVNAANTYLLPGGGVDGAIHHAAGPLLYEELKHYKGLPTGKALLTKGYKLKAPYIIHAVGPIWEEEEKKDTLSSLLIQTYQSIFDLVSLHGFNTIAIPNISTGVYGFPKALAASLVINTTRAWITRSKFKGTIYFYCFDEENYQLYQRYLNN